MADKFKVTWHVEDGYVGGDRPHSFNISVNELYEGMDETEMRELFQENLNSDFENKISYHSNDEDAFVKWAKEQLEQSKGN